MRAPKKEWPACGAEGDWRLHLTGWVSGWAANPLPRLVPFFSYHSTLFANVSCDMEEDPGISEWVVSQKGRCCYSWRLRGKDAISVACRSHISICRLPTQTPSSRLFLQSCNFSIMITKVVNE